MYTHNGRTIQPNRAWTSDDGYQQPANWSKCWGDAELEKWSVTYTADPVKKSFDNKFYHGYEVDADGNETDKLIPKSLVDVEEKDADGNNLKDLDGNNLITLGLKSVWIAKKKDEANELLNKTDWYIIRAAEGGSAVPSAVTTDRTAIRTACAGIETKITNAADLDAFMALFDRKDNGDPSDIECY
jgi:hypothetical protein